MSDRIGLGEGDIAQRYNGVRTIRFLHGWPSVPGGRKPTYLARHGHEVINPKLPNEDFEKTVMIPQVCSTSTNWMPS